MSVSRFAVETDGLSKHYDGRAAVDSVDLRVERGSVYGLVGPNGSGKTTTLALLAGLRHPSSGLTGVHVDRTSVALLPDTPEFEPWLSGREVVELASSLVTGHSAGSGVDEALREAGIDNAADRRVGGYSRGMLQRLGIASTVVTNAELLLLDEPCSALDPVGRREILDLIARQRGRRTAIFSSHILSDVQEVCDTIGIMRAGRLIFQGPLSSLLAGDATPAILVRLRVSDPAVVRVLEEQPWIRSATTIADGELRLEVTSTQEAERGLAAALAAAHAIVVSVRPEEASLERAFLELTK